MHSAILTSALCAICLAAAGTLGAADATTPGAAPTPQAATPQAATPQASSPRTTTSTTNQTTVIVVDPQHGHDHHDGDHAQTQPPAPSQSATAIGPTNEATHLWSDPQSPSNPGQKQSWDHSPTPPGPQPMDHIQSP